jgi:SHS2 domain-containing protein
VLRILKCLRERQMTGRGHETLDHMADMGILGWGTTASEAFEEAASAMLELMCETSGLESLESVEINCEGDSLDELLIEFLNALISRSDIEDMAFLGTYIARMERVAGKWVIEATAKGIPRKLVDGRLLAEVKAATYCGVSVRQVDSGRWEAQCVVDL